MKIGVLLKQTPATDSRIRIMADGTGIETGDINWIVSAYDEHGLEQAATIKGKDRKKEVILFTLGGKGFQGDRRIRDGLAKGGDRAVWLSDAAFEGSDSLGTARALAAAVKAEGVDILFAGKQAVDDDNAQVGAMVAELLGWPQVTIISKLELDGDTFRATRDAGQGQRQVVQGKLPAVFTADKALNTPRYAKLPDIMKARRKKIAQKKPADLGIDASQVGAAGRVVMESNWGPPPERPQGRILEGEPEAVVQELVKLLREEAKVI